MDFEVHRDDARHRYHAEIDGHQAEIRFVPAGDHVLDFQHTQVAPELRGRGVADVLVRHALEDVRSRGERIIPTCPFVKAFVARHPEFRSLVAASG
jgi:predicted GNAT family acetyltransferase